ncbi:MAG: YbaB/EbfC family nucleoid-associated protein [Chitinivibrionales bacterium]
MAKNMNKLLKQAQKMQSQMMKAQEELNRKEVEGTAGGGMVKVVMNGAQELQSVKIDPEVVDKDDVEMLEDLIIAAFNNAQEQIKEFSNETMGNISGGLNLPGLG